MYSMMIVAKLNLTDVYYYQWTGMFIYMCIYKLFSYAMKISQLYNITFI